MERRGLWLALALAFAARLPALLLGVEHYGDAPVRIEIAERWARDPHLWRGFGETYQFGPLHLSMLGVALKALPDRYLAPKLLSLVCGLLSVALLWLLTARLRDRPAATFAACALALSPLHIQASTTGASETPFLALLLAALLLARPHVLWSALLLGAAGLVRYDGWFYVPFLALTIRPWRKAAVFFAVAVAPAALWLLRNGQFGDPLAPIHWIDRDHENLARMAIGWFGEGRYRLYSAGFFPQAVLVILSPVVGLLAMAGVARAIWKRLPGWELAAIAWAPIAYYVFRAAVLLNFRPLTRFAMTTAALSLPFAWDAVGWIGERLRRPVLALAGISLVATPLVLAGLSLGRNGSNAEWARPISPVSSVPPGIEEAARWVRAHARPDDVVLLDGVWDYLDIPLAFEAGLPEPQWIRVAWKDDYEARWARVRPTMAVVIYQGTLESTFGKPDRFTIRGVELCVAQRFVYATIYRRCGPSVSNER